MLPEGTDLSHHDTMSTPPPPLTCNPANLTVNTSKARLYFSSISNNVALEHLHSTPMLRKQCDSTAIPQDDVIEISPLCHQCNNSHREQSHASSFENPASPDLFFDSSSVGNRNSEALLSEYESKLEPKSESDFVDLTKNHTLQMTDDLELTGQEGSTGQSSTPSVEVKTISNQMNKLCLLSAEVHLERLTYDQMSDQLNKENTEDGQRNTCMTDDYSFVVRVHRIMYIQ